MTATYPAHREATIVLRDSSTLTLRPVRTEDAVELARFRLEAGAPRPPMGAR